MELVLKSIGHVRSNQVEPYEASRQPDELGDPASIEINKNSNFELALQDLEGCSHIWILFGFHHNQNWKPLVQTPRSDRKIGLFATRAPYRPNPIGLSCVPLISVSGLSLVIGPNDLLNGTPVYDIKPYLAESDRIDDSSIQWLQSSVHQKLSVNISPSAEDEIDFLEISGVSQLRSFLIRQLQYDALNSAKKRVTKNNHCWTLSYRTWRIDFLATEENIGVVGIRSGYTVDDLKQIEDKYQDKEIHKKFVKRFS